MKVSLPNTKYSPRGEAGQLPDTGFTLVELLVVIALIGILSTLLLANFNAARQRSRDAQRKSDLRNLQTALRLYYNDNVGYPTSNGGYEIVGCGSKAARIACPWATAWTTTEGQTYMTRLPKDPQAIDYRYIQTDSDNFTLTACLENKSDDKGISDTSGWCTSSWVYQVKP